MLYHRGRRLQSGQGFGIGGIFGGLLRSIMPVAKTVAKVATKAARSGLGRKVGRELKSAALQSTLNLLDGDQGSNVSPKQRFKDATKNILKAAAASPKSKRKTRDRPYHSRRRRGGPRAGSYRYSRSRSPMF